MRKIMFHLNCLEQGGAERVVTNLAHQFADRGYEVIIATEWFGENEFQIADSIRRIHVGLREEDERKSRLATQYLRIRYLRELIRRERPDVVIAFARKANYRALMAGLGTGIPVMVSVRTDPVGHYDGPADKMLIPLLYPRAAGCVFQTTGQRAFFAEKIQKKSRIILNPVNPKYIGVPAPKQREKCVVQSGRLVDFKNQQMLIRAFVDVHRKHPDYCLKIYGPDSGDGTKALLEACIREHQADGYVKLMGGSDRLEEVLTDAAVFAFSSDWEGLPNALLEAMALGLPIVATDCPCGGPRTVMEDGVNGLLIPIRDQKAMTEGINYLLEHPAEAEAMGQKAREISRIANGDAIFEQWKAYIEEICAGPHRKG